VSTFLASSSLTENIPLIKQLRGVKKDFMNIVASLVLVVADYIEIKYESTFNVVVKRDREHISSLRCGLHNTRFIK
jgi:hypothetical protein